jgi:hypothetical protein
MSGDRPRYVRRFDLDARILAESCESCLQRPFHYLHEDTFVCPSCLMYDWED